MNAPNPLVPQGSLHELKSKSHLRIAVCTILGIHVVVIIGLLIAGCKRDTTTADNQIATNKPPLFEPTVSNDTNPPTPAAHPPETALNPNPGTPLNPTSPITEPAPGSLTEYTVAKFDSFSSIGKKLGVSAKAIAAANPSVEPTKLQIGQKLQIPARVAAAPAPGAPAPEGAGAPSPAGEAVYVVKSNDNLTKIAKAHGTTLKALRAANSLKTDHIKVGQKLKLPAKTAPAVPSGSTAAAAPAPTHKATPSAASL